MITRNDLTCPVCRSFDLKQAYELQVAGNFTTRKYREANNLEIDSMQQLCVPPHDASWFGCNMCGTEFDGNSKIYNVNKWFGYYNEK